LPIEFLACLAVTMCKSDISQGYLLPCEKLPWWWYAEYSFSSRYLAIWRIPSGRFPVDSFWRELYAYAYIEARSAEKVRRIRWPAIRSQFIRRTSRPRDRADDDWISFTNPHGINKTSASHSPRVLRTRARSRVHFIQGWPWYRRRARWDNIYSYLWPNPLLILFGLLVAVERWFRRVFYIALFVLLAWDRAARFNSVRIAGRLPSITLMAQIGIISDFFHLLAAEAAVSCSGLMPGTLQENVIDGQIGTHISRIAYRASRSVYRVRSLRACLVPS